MRVMPFSATCPINKSNKRNWIEIISYLFNLNKVESKSTSKFMHIVLYKNRPNKKFSFGYKWCRVQPASWKKWSRVWHAINSLRQLSFHCFILPLCITREKNHAFSFFFQFYYFMQTLRSVERQHLNRYQLWGWFLYIFYCLTFIEPQYT